MKTKLALALALVLASSSSTLAAKGKGTHTAPLPSSIFVAVDPSEPNKLTHAPGFQGLDRGYVEAMTRPPIRREVLDEIERIQGKRTTQLARPAPSSANPFLASVIAGDVFVVEGSSALVVNTQNGLGFDHNNGMFEIANQVLSRLGDNFDFITVFTTFSDFNVAAYYSPLQNQIEGLGECNFQSGETFGCDFPPPIDGLRLQGLVFMNSIETWRDWDRSYDGVVHPLESFDSAVYSTLGQEIAHRWGSGLRFVDPRTGNVSKKLLGRDRSHWAAYVDTDASVMDGWDWSEPTDGRFDLVNDMDVYSTLDLYTMGALPVGFARPFFFIDGAVFDERDGLGINGRVIPGDAVLSFGLPSVSYMEEFGIDLGARGEKVELTVQDIIDAEGNRCPDADHAPKAFRQAVVLVTRIGETSSAASSDTAELAVVADTWETWFSDRTGHALTLCTSLTEDCTQASVTLGGGTVESEQEIFVERGKTGTIKMSATAAGADVKNAVLHVRIEGNGAESAGILNGGDQFTETDIAVGDIADGKTAEFDVEVAVDDDYPCGSSIVVVAELRSDNAATAKEEYRLFPGYAPIFLETFGLEDDFKVNDDGKDDTNSGKFERVDIALSCEMTERTPERDATPANTGAFVTGLNDELDGDTSLWSPEIDLAGTAAPELRYSFWLDGKAGDSLKVQITGDGGETFKTAAEETESFHGWGLGNVSIKDTFDGGIPGKIRVRFVFTGNGQLEGAVDDVRVIDPQGECRSIATFGCACSADGTAGPQASLFAMLGLFGLRALTARRRARER